MNRCPKCGALCEENAKFCEECGQSLNTEKTLPLWVKVVIPIMALAIVALGVVLVMGQSGSTKEEPSETMTLSSQESISAITSNDTTTIPSTEATSTSANVTSAPDKLYRPDASLFVNQYSAYVYCTDTSVQDYVKMRYGPSKEKYEVVGTLPNYAEVTVETKSVDGWTLIFDGFTEGWVRSDFVFTR